MLLFFLRMFDESVHISLWLFGDNLWQPADCVQIAMSFTYRAIVRMIDLGLSDAYIYYVA